MENALNRDEGFVENVVEPVDAVVLASNDSNKPAIASPIADVDVYVANHKKAQEKHCQILKETLSKSHYLKKGKRNPDT